MEDGPNRLGCVQPAIGPLTSISTLRRESGSHGSAVRGSPYYLVLAAPRRDLHRDGSRNRISRKHVTHVRRRCGRMHGPREQRVLGGQTTCNVVVPGVLKRAAGLHGREVIQVQVNNTGRRVMDGDGHEIHRFGNPRCGGGAVRFHADHLHFQLAVFSSVGWRGLSGPPR